MKHGFDGDRFTFLRNIYIKSRFRIELYLINEVCLISLHKPPISRGKVFITTNIKSKINKMKAHICLNI
jgi:hypothetical protein